MMTATEINTATREQLAEELAAAGEYTGDWATAEIGDLRERVEMLGKVTVEGHLVRIDRSGVGHAWRAADSCDCPASIQEEIAAEIIDGKQDECEDFVASNGLHYRW